VAKEERVEVVEDVIGRVVTWETVECKRLVKGFRMMEGRMDVARICGWL
jgi:hypothetical protein